MGNQSEADLRTERINQALNPNTQFYSISRSGHDMESLVYLAVSVNQVTVIHRQYIIDT